jgi:protoporphyrinogen oxidase
MKIGIVGGGLMGLALAYYLGKQGHRVTVFERDRQLGGLTTHHDYGPFTWDRFYHVILPSDSKLVGFIQDLGLGDKLRWAKTRTGFFVDRQFYSISNNLEFLRFPLVGLWGKFRLGLTVIYGSRIQDWERLERITVADWLTRMCGKSTYEKFWKPLLLAKLGESYKRVSAVFIWAYIKRLYSARDPSVGKEQLGYVSGGYKTVFDRLAQRIASASGEIRTGVTVTRIEPEADSGLAVLCGEQRERFDQVIFTSPVNVLQAAAAPELIHFQPGGQVEYLGVICANLITRKALLPYYTTNLADARIPFTGVIGMSNLVSLDETNGLHLTYLPKYAHSDDPIFQQKDEELRELFFQGIRLLFPDLKDEDIVSVHINRALKVQPLQVVNYSKIVPKVRTGHPAFFVLNTSQFVNNSLNNNEVITAVTDFMAKYESGPT